MATNTVDAVLQGLAHVSASYNEVSPDLLSTVTTARTKWAQVWRAGRHLAHYRDTDAATIAGLIGQPGAAGTDPTAHHAAPMVVASGRSLFSALMVVIMATGVNPFEDNSGIAGGNPATVPACPWTDNNVAAGFVTPLITHYQALRNELLSMGIALLPTAATTAAPIVAAGTIVPAAAAKPVRPKLPEFDGEPSHFREWAANVDMLVRNNEAAWDTEGALRSDIIVSCKGDLVSQVVRDGAPASTGLGKINTLNALLQWMGTTFESRTALADALRELRQYTHAKSNLPFAAFVQHLTVLRTRAGLGVSQADMVDAIRAKWKPGYYSHVLTRNLFTYADIMAVCPQEEQYLDPPAPRRRTGAPFVQRQPEAVLLNNNVRWVWSDQVPANRRCKLSEIPKGEQVPLRGTVPIQGSK